MPEGQNFSYGGVSFPLTASTSNTLLRDADPALYYALEFFAQVITTHVGSRLVAEATAAGATDIVSAVADAIPIDPEQYLTEEHLKFPLLTMHREGTTFKYLSLKRVSVHRVKLAYVLPPLRAAQAERLLPVLHAVGLLIDRKATQGLDSSYTPTAPTGTAGEFVWSGTRAGISKIEILESSIGAFQAPGDLYFPAVTMTLELSETSNSDLSSSAANGGYDPFEGADVQIDAKQAFDGTTLEDVVDFNTYQPLTVTSISPTTGLAAGGLLVTITGTNFKPDTRLAVLFDGKSATEVTVVDSTTITCVTPAHAAYTSFVADVTVIAADSQSAELSAAFTYTQT